MWGWKLVVKINLAYTMFKKNFFWISCQFLNIEKFLRKILISIVLKICYMWQKWVHILHGINWLTVRGDTSLLDKRLPNLPQASPLPTVNLILLDWLRLLSDSLRNVRSTLHPQQLVSLSLGLRILLCKRQGVCTLGISQIVLIITKTWRCLLKIQLQDLFPGASD